jgi:hypothetical protein
MSFQCSARGGLSGGKPSSPFRTMGLSPFSLDLPSICRPPDGGIKTAGDLDYAIECESK